MSRIVRDAKLESRSARCQLKVSGKPYYRALESGLHLGYRKGKKGGRWVVRLYVGDKDYKVRGIEGIPDDLQDADGKAVLSYAQAQEQARAMFRTENAPAGTGRSALTVKAACEDYVEFLKAERKTGKESAGRLEKHIYPLIGTKVIVELISADIEKVKRAMVRKDPKDPDVERKSKDSANRVMSMLRAALNRAFEDESNNISTDAAWRRVKQYENVTRARQVHLDPPQSRGLIAVCRLEPDFQKLITSTLLTGARAPHELSARLVKDFRKDLGTLTVLDGKTGYREIVLTKEAIDYFDEITKDRDPDELLLHRASGEPWGKNNHIKPMKRAVKLAKLPKKCTIYSLRHTYASQSILAGMNLKLLAENMGTSIRMLEKHYGKFIAAARRQLVEQSAFKIGLHLSSKPQEDAA